MLRAAAEDEALEEVDDVELGDRLQRAWSAATSAWPDLSLQPETFFNYMGARARPGLRLLDHASDLYLACAVVTGVPRATRRFEQEFGPEIDRGLARLNASVDDAAQDLRIRLLVGQEGRAPKLASYAASSPLLHWLRIVVVRMRTDLVRARARAVEPKPLATEALAARLADEQHPELVLGCEGGAAVLETSLRQALMMLPARDRVLLRQHFVEGLSARRICVAYGVHHATAKRWLVRAKRALWDATREVLRSEHRLTPRTIASIVRDAGPRLEADLSELLRSK